jgi:uncharacterized membrane protein
MDEGKDLLTSKTTWGALLLAAQPILSQFGIDIDVDTITTAIVNVAGIALFVWGQISRSKKIVSVGGVKLPQSGG